MVDVQMGSVFFKIDYIISDSLKMGGRTFSSLSDAQEDKSYVKWFQLDISRPFCF